MRGRVLAGVLFAVVALAFSGFGCDDDPCGCTDLGGTPCRSSSGNDYYDICCASGETCCESFEGSTSCVPTEQGCPRVCYPDHHTMCRRDYFCFYSFSESDMPPEGTCAQFTSSVHVLCGEYCHPDQRCGSGACCGDFTRCEDGCCVAAPPDAGILDAGIEDASTADAGVADAGT